MLNGLNRAKRLNPSIHNSGQDTLNGLSLQDRDWSGRVELWHVLIILNSLNGWNYERLDRPIKLNVLNRAKRLNVLNNLNPSDLKLFKSGLIAQ